MSVSESLSFRLSPQYLEQLEAEAMRRGISRGDLARQLVIEGLTARDQENASFELAEIQSSIRLLDMNIRELQEQLGNQHHEVARSLKTLNPAEAAELDSSVKHVQDQVIKLREDFATGLVALLTYAGHWKVEDAIDFVETKLLNHK